MTERYRWRTRARRHLPTPIAFFFPKGRKDCGDHEFYNDDNLVDRCYHCRVGVRTHESA